MPRPQTDNRAGHGRRWRVRRARRCATPEVAQPLGEALLSLLEAMGGTPERAGLQNLWDNWEAALGAELAGLARPLGHRCRPASGAGKTSSGGGQGAVLLLGADDAMLLQELRFRGEEILARVNGFLGRAYFSEVQVSLPLGRRSPERTRSRERQPVSEREVCPAWKGPSGIFLETMDRTSPVARCYARFAGREKASIRDRDAEKDDKGEKLK